jgi:Zn-dependent M28 family amino/carboxypeptidase
MGPPTGVVRSDIPAISVKYEDGLMIKRLMEKDKDTKIRLYANLTPIKTKSWNVCGEIPGNGKSDEFIMFGGHYDGHEIAQAAFDCGAPCTISMEVGRILDTVSEEIDRDVRIVLFSSEECGCQGSQDYANRHSSDMDKMRFTYQLDCTGAPGTQMVTTAYWDQLNPFYKKLSDDLELVIPHEQRMGPGDTRAFMELGIPTGSIMNHRGSTRRDLLKTYRHTYYDTFDKLDIRSMREATLIGAVSAFRMLNMSDFPKHRGKKELDRIKNM